MGIYSGLFLIALAVAFLAVRVYQSRTTDNGVGKTVTISSQARHRPYKRKQKGSIGSASRVKPKSKAMGRSVLSMGTVQKPWGW